MKPFSEFERGATVAVAPQLPHPEAVYLQSLLLRTLHYELSNALRREICDVPGIREKLRERMESAYPDPNGRGQGT
jgi:hypothetical protein